MYLHGAVLPGLRRRAGADFVHDHDVRGAAAAAIAASGFANLCCWLRGRRAPACSAPRTARNTTIYRDNFARNESFDSGRAIALPGPHPARVKGRQPVAPTDGAGAVPAGGGSSLPLSGGPGIGPAGITTGARGASLKRDAKAQVTPAHCIA
jgi:hypothetical protein